MMMTVSSKKIVKPEYSELDAGGRDKYKTIVEFINNENNLESIREFVRTTAPNDKQKVKEKVEQDLKKQIMITTTTIRPEDF